MLALLVKYKLAITAAALLGAVGLGGVGVAAASGALPLTALSALNIQHAKPRPGAARHPGLAAHIIHGAVILNDNGSWTSYTLDVGTVTAASSSSITLLRIDGGSVTLSVDSSTRWGAQDKAPKDYSRLVGRRVAVLSQNGAAVHIGGRGIFKGFAYADLTVIRNGATREIQLDRGAVQSISSSQISLTRADGVAVTAPLASTARYHQAGVKGPASASAVTPGETVTLLVYNGQVVAIRIAPAQNATPPAS
ncbi:MAG TPA: hypothetical protein VFQ25_13495 [Ktedonobacterales bacterium]|nr:hypothetical protein [Ktedonobacterales bacterium]